MNQGTGLFHYRSKYQRKTSFPLVICSLIRTFAADYEKSRNEKNRNMENPFKFGTIVEAEYFTDRIEEVAYISHFVESANHLVLISPRRFGKSSVVAKALKQKNTGTDSVLTSK